MFLGKDARLRMTEEQATNDISETRDYRRGKITADREVTLRHSSIRRIFPVAAIFLDVVGTNDSLPTKGRAEYLRVPRHRESREGFTRSTGQGIERVALSRLIDKIMKKR